jgi:hypothetical protein
MPIEYIATITFLDYYRVLVAEGVSGQSTYLTAVEIIDLQSPNMKCSKLPNSPYYLAGTHGGLDENQAPWICGGFYEPSQATYTNCWTYRTESWKTTNNLNYKRAYSGISQLANGSYFLSGGIKEHPWKSFEKTEVLRNYSWTTLSPDLPATIYQHCQVEKNLIISC